MTNESNILDVLAANGPLTGFELQQKTNSDVFELWRDCHLSERINSKIFSRRYLRLDRKMKDYARLSPSIRREFLTYTVLGALADDEAISLKAQQLTNDQHNISLRKRRLARENMIQCVSETSARDAIIEHTCFIIAGDVVYNMAHDVPRPESSTGELVRGSDLDIIIVHDNCLEPDIINQLDSIIHARKHYLLVHPSHREEIDYVIKDIDRTRNQTMQRSFEDMVACKILWEGQLLFGSSKIFDQIQTIIQEQDVATEASRTNLAHGDNHTLFYTQEEHEEIY